MLREYHYAALVCFIYTYMHAFFYFILNIITLFWTNAHLV